MANDAGTPGPDPSTAETPEAFVRELNRLRAWAGRPSLRALGRRAGGRTPGGRTAPLPASTVHEVLAGRRLPRLPRLEFVEAYVTACLRMGRADDSAIEAEVQRWRSAWRRLADAAERPHTPACAADGDAVGSRSAVSVGTAAPAGTATPTRAGLPTADRPTPAVRLVRHRSTARWLAVVAIFAAGVTVGVVTVRFVDGRSALTPGAPTVTTASVGRCEPTDAPRPARSALIAGGGAVAQAPPNGAGTGGWRNVKDTGIGLVHDGAVLRLAVQGGSAGTWERMVVHDGISLAAGKRYVLSLTLATNAPVTVRTTVQEASPPYHAPLLQDVPVDGTPCRRSFPFTADRAVERGQVTLQLGGHGHDFTLAVADAYLAAV